ncbi:MAG: TauD/TfdA family dioxygenase, partial [Actinomycetota bacterium]
MTSDADLEAIDWSTVNIEPPRIENRSEVAAAVRDHGAVVVTGVEPGAEAARQLASDIFGDRVRAVPEAAKVTDGGEKDRKPDGLDHRTRSRAHTDGFAYGDLCPDHFLLACERHSGVGGESLLLDGYAILDRLAATPATAELADELSTTIIDQTEPGMRPSFSPIVRATPSGRRMLRRTSDQYPAPDSADPDHDAEMIRLWKLAIDIASDAIDSSQRPKLGAGEAVVVDNYRMFHGREAYTDLGRLMWRVWI